MNAWLLLRKQLPMFGKSSKLKMHLSETKTVELKLKQMFNNKLVLKLACLGHSMKITIKDSCGIVAACYPPQ